jgi:hypothetical protein
VGNRAEKGQCQRYEKAVQATLPIGAFGGNVVNGKTDAEGNAKGANHHQKRKDKGQGKHSFGVSDVM